MASTTGKKPNAAAEKTGMSKNSAATADNESTVNQRWTFLTNHSHVLVLLHNDPDAVLRHVALQVGITERAVQRIIQDLERGGVIERERIGRRNHYKVLADQPLRHTIEANRSIGDLLELLCKDE